MMYGGCTAANIAVSHHCLPISRKGCKAVHYWHDNYATIAEVALIGMAAGAAADTADAALTGVIVGTSETCSIRLPKLKNLQ